MKLKPMTDICCKGGICPMIYETDAGTFVIQGRRVALSECEGLSDIPAHEELVEIPRELRDRLLTEFDKG